MLLWHWHQQQCWYKFGEMLLTVGSVVINAYCANWAIRLLDLQIWHGLHPVISEHNQLKSDPSIKWLSRPWVHRVLLAIMSCKLIRGKCIVDILLERTMATRSRFRWIIWISNDLGALTSNTNSNSSPTPTVSIVTFLKTVDPSKSHPTAIMASHGGRVSSAYGLTMSLSWSSLSGMFLNVGPLFYLITI